MLLWGCTEGNSCSLARGCGFPGDLVAQGREEQQDGTERGARESFEPAATWLGSVRRGGQGDLRGAVSVLDVFCVPARTLLCSTQTFQQGKLREHLGLGVRVGVSTADCGSRQPPAHGALCLLQPLGKSPCPGLPATWLAPQAAACPCSSGCAGADPAPRASHPNQAMPRRQGSTPKQQVE